MFGWLWMWTKKSMSLSSTYRRNWNHCQPYYPSHYRVLYEALSRHNNLPPNQYDHHLTDEYLSPLVVQALALGAFAAVARPRRHRQSLSLMTRRRRQLGLLWSKMSEAHKQSQRERNKNHFSMTDFKNILIHSANSIFMLHTIWIYWAIAQHVREKMKIGGNLFSRWSAGVRREFGSFVVFIFLFCVWWFGNCTTRTRAALEYSKSNHTPNFRARQWRCWWCWCATLLFKSSRLDSVELIFSRSLFCVCIFVST